MIDGLTFDDATHTYRFNGSVVPGVTRVLQQLQYLQGIPRDILNAAADFGRNVHLACHLFNKGDLDEDSLDPALAPYLNQYKRFLRDTGFKVTGSEIFVYNEMYGYAGQEDFEGEFLRTTWGVDIKSGMVPSTVGAQTAAYQQARPKAVRPKKRACLKLEPNDYKFIEQKEFGDFSLFTSALNCWRHNQKHNPRMFDHEHRTAECA